MSEVSTPFSTEGRVAEKASDFRLFSAVPVTDDLDGCCRRYSQRKNPVGLRLSGRN